MIGTKKMGFYRGTDMSGLKLGGTKIFLKEILSMINYQVFRCRGMDQRVQCFDQKRFFNFKNEFKGEKRSNLLIQNLFEVIAKSRC